MHQERAHVLPFPRNDIGREKNIPERPDAFRELGVRHPRGLGKRENVRRLILASVSPIHRSHFGIRNQKNAHLDGAFRKAWKHVRERLTRCAYRGAKTGKGRFYDHPSSFALTFAPTAEASTRAPFAAFIMAPITFPISFTLCAPVALMASSTSLFTSVSGSASGR